MKTFLIHPEDAQKILSYLATRPYAEVFQLIPILHTMEETEVEIEEPTDLEVT
jgi:hypothetical protein